MQETPPLFIIKKYRGILRAAIIVEAVSYIVSLTDSFVTGNMISETAMAAIGLSAPFLSLSTFFASIINSGTVMNYSYHIGRFDRKRAQEFSSQGIFMALLTGVIYSGILFLFRNPIIRNIADTAEMQQYAAQYFNIILLLYLLNPLSYLLDNLTVADGGEKLSAAANIVFIISNVLLSLLFAGRWGIQGVAAASVMSRLLFIVIICFHFFDNTNTLRLTRHWRNADGITVIRSGIVKASTYALEAFMIYAVNRFTIYYFESSTLILLVMVEKFLGLLTIFIGLAMAAQPLIGTLKGENNIKALRYLMKKVCSDMIFAGLLLSVLTFLFSQQFVQAFGLHEEPLMHQGITAIRIVSSTLMLHAVLVLFFIYYYLMDHQLLAFMICVFKNLLSPLTLAVLFSYLIDTQTGLWAGLAIAPILSVIVCGTLIYWKYRKNPSEEFPFLLPKDSRTRIYNFEITPDNAAAMSLTADTVLEEFAIPKRTRVLAGVYLEDMLLLIREKNAGKKVQAECTFIAEPNGIRLILRDSGILFDITDEDAMPESFRQYVVTSLMVAQQYKAYMPTTGYNRNELFFPEP